MKRKRQSKKSTLNILTRIRKYFPQVEVVEDSSQSIEVHVTENDGQRASKKSPSDCALARACIREKQVDGAIIGISRSYLVKGKRAVRFMTPVSVGREITSFDRDSGFEPGTYRLSKVAATQQLGAKSQSYCGPKTGPPKPPPLMVHRTENIRVVTSR